MAEEVKSGSPLLKACAKAGRGARLRRREGELAGWVWQQFRHGACERARRRGGADAAVGDDLRHKAEVDKLATWAGEEPVGEGEVEALVAADADVPIWELTEAWSAP